MSDEKKITTGDRIVQMFYPPEAKGPREMILHGVGYFKKGQLFGQHVDSKGVVRGAPVAASLAEAIEKTGKGPRVATDNDVNRLQPSAPPNKEGEAPQRREVAKSDATAEQNNEASAVQTTQTKSVDAAQVRRQR